MDGPVGAERRQTADVLATWAIRGYEGGRTRGHVDAGALRMTRYRYTGD